MSVVHNYVWDPAYQNKDYTTGGWVRMSTSMIGGASAADIVTEVAAKVNGLPAGVAWIRTTTVSESSGTTTLNGVGSNGTAYTRTISESGGTTTISPWVPA